jgi:hypothetical protein
VITRETKVGLVVAGSFLSLVGIVLASKLRPEEPARADASQAATTVAPPLAQVKAKAEAALKGPAAQKVDEPGAGHSKRSAGIELVSAPPRLNAPPAESAPEVNQPAPAEGRAAPATGDSSDGKEAEKSEAVAKEKRHKKDKRDAAEGRPVLTIEEKQSKAEPAQPLPRDTQPPAAAEKDDKEKKTEPAEVPADAEKSSKADPVKDSLRKQMDQSAQHDGAGAPVKESAAPEVKEPAPAATESAGGDAKTEKTEAPAPPSSKADERKTDPHADRQEPGAGGKVAAPADAPPAAKAPAAAPAGPAPAKAADKPAASAGAAGKPERSAAESGTAPPATPAAPVPAGPAKPADAVPVLHPSRPGAALAKGIQVQGGAPADDRGSAGHGATGQEVIPPSRGAPPEHFPTVGARAAAESPVIPVPTPPAQPEARSTVVPRVESFDVETYEAKSGDTFASISKAFYYGDKYKDALLKFNREYHQAAPEITRDPPVLGAGQRVVIPPLWVLEKRYAELIPDLKPIRDGQPPVLGTPQPEAAAPPAGERTSRSESPAVIPASGRAAPTGTRQYKVSGKGERFYDIARTTLGNADRWNEIYGLNPGFPPEREVPPGTLLRLPADAHVEGPERP